MIIYSSCLTNLISKAALIVWSDFLARQSGFHHNEELTLRAFDARVTALLYNFLPSNVEPDKLDKVNSLLKQAGALYFLEKVDEIHSLIFDPDKQFSKCHESDPLFDHEFSAHAKFIQHMEVYKTFKQAIDLHILA